MLPVQLKTTSSWIACIDKVHWTHLILLFIFTAYLNGWKCEIYGISAWCGVFVYNLPYMKVSNFLFLSFIVLFKEVNYATLMIYPHNLLYKIAFISNEKWTQKSYLWEIFKVGDKYSIFFRSLFLKITWKFLENEIWKQFASPVHCPNSRETYLYYKTIYISASEVNLIKWQI